MEALPEDDICESQIHAEHCVADCRDTLCLAIRQSDCDFGALTEPEPPGASEAQTVSLSGREQYGGRLRVSRLAAVTLAVAGVGVSIRLSRRPNEHRDIGSSATVLHAVGLSSSGRERGAVRLVHHQAKVSVQGRDGRRRRGVHRRGVARDRPVRVSWLGVSESAYVRPMSAQTAGRVPRVESGSAGVSTHLLTRPASQPVPASRRSPCVPGTLGC
jgi:hypothetical protein